MKLEFCRKLDSNPPRVLSYYHLSFTFQILITSAGSLPSQICPTPQFPTADDLRLGNKTTREGTPATASGAAAPPPFRSAVKKPVGDES